jgi:hypothetical protein
MNAPRDEWRADPVRARHDPARGGRVVARRPLLYARGPDAAFDRPAHVRAGSSLVSLDREAHRLAVIQDDACFLAVLDRRTGIVHDVPFPADDGERQFDDTRKNKSRKLDLEAAFVAEGGALLVALGSGSSPLRERVVLVEDPTTDSPRVTIVGAPALYAALRREAAFTGSELNIEGAALDGDDLLLFQRGNGAPSSACRAIDATARLAAVPLLASFRAALRHDGTDMPDRADTPPVLRDVVTWDLGTIDGGRLTFTDGAIGPRRGIVFLACAEASPDATRDGPVSAVAIGSLDDRARTCELGLIVDETGAPLLDKAEGLAFDATDDTRAYVVTDKDDPAAPSELLEIRLGEAWSR